MLLVEIALRVHEADADERHAEVAGFLAVVAGEHAKAAGVNRQRLVKGELGGEVGDGVRCGRDVIRPPRAAGGRRRSHGVQCFHGSIVVAEKGGVGGRALQRVSQQPPQHQHRVVRRLPPQRVIQLAEDLTRRRVPGPPQMVRKLAKTGDALGKTVELDHTDESNTGATIKTRWVSWPSDIHASGSRRR